MSNKVVKFVPSDLPNMPDRYIEWMGEKIIEGAGWEPGAFFFDTADEAKAEYADYAYGPSDKPTIYRVTVEVVEGTE